jgi:hypothetical protein
MCARIFRSDALQDLYAGTGGAAIDLNTLRTAGSAEAQEGLASLDRRIAAFEFVLIGSLPAGQSPADYPYDREGLRREFLDELVTLLMRRSISDDPALKNLYIDPSSLIFSLPATAGGVHLGINKNTPVGDPSFGIFATQTVSATHAQIFSDERRNFLNIAGKAIFDRYSLLIDSTFAEGDKLGNNPSREAQVTSAISPLTVDGVTYDRISQVAGIKTISSGTPPVSSQVPDYQTYLLESTAPVSQVAKSANGDATLTGPASSAARRLQITTTEVPPFLPNLFRVAIDGANLFVDTTGGSITIRNGVFAAPIPATPIKPLSLNITGQGHEFPESRVVATYRATAPNGITYLIGLGSDGKVYATSLAPARRSAVGTTATLSSMEYLLFFNEARIKILRAKLAYNEAVVREIQEDLRQANEALAELETQAGAIVATNSDGSLTGQTSSETLTMNFFNAVHSTAGSPIFSLAGADSIHVSREWETNRVNLKNYIDRRSAEAQQATLDYQNTLNRFNNAFEIMAKLQEKLDTLLKAQVRNLS